MSEDVPEIPDKYKRKGVFVARWGGGRCGICDEEINVGDECQYLDDEICHLECIP